MKRQLTEFGKNVKIELIRQGMTQVQLADQLGINKQYLYKILAGERPGSGYIEEIKRILKINDKAA